MSKQTEECFGREFVAFRHNLERRAKENHLSFQLQQALTFQEGKLQLTSGGKWIEIAVKKPDEIGTGAELEQAWGFIVRDWIGGDGEVYARFPNGWKHWNRIGPGWDDVDLEAHFWAYASRTLGLKAEAASA